MTAMSTPAVLEDTLLFPIGEFQGDAVGPPGSESHHRQVRLGAELISLSEAELAVWAAAHGNPQDPNSAWTRTDMVALLDQANIEDPTAEIGSLSERGLLFEVADKPSARRQFALHHRMVPIMLGLGNTPEEPWYYSIGTLGNPVIKLQSPLYDLWEWAHMDPNLWVAVRGATATAKRVGVTDPDQIEPDRLLKDLVDALHAMLTGHTVYLDRGLAR